MIAPATYDLTYADAERLKRVVQTVHPRWDITISLVDGYKDGVSYDNSPRKLVVDVMCRPGDKEVARKTVKEIQQFAGRIWEGKLSDDAIEVRPSVKSLDQSRGETRTRG